MLDKIVMKAYRKLETTINKLYCMKTYFLSFLEDFSNRLKIKSKQLSEAAQGPTADLSALLVVGNAEQIDQCCEQIRGLSQNDPNFGLKLRDTLLAAIDVLFKERERVIDIVKVAPVPTHLQAQENNRKYIERALTLLGMIQTQYNLPLPDIYDKKELPRLQNNTSSSLSSNLVKWMQTRIKMDEANFLSRGFDDNNEESMEKLEYLARLLLAKQKLANIEAKILGASQSSLGIIPSKL